MTEHPIESRLVQISDCGVADTGQKQTDSGQKQTCPILRSCIYLRYTSPLQDSMVETSKGVARGGTFIENRRDVQPETRDGVEID